MFSNDEANQSVDRNLCRVPERMSDVLVDHRELVSIHLGVGSEVCS